MRARRRAEKLAIPIFRRHFLCAARPI